MNAKPMRLALIITLILPLAACNLKDGRSGKSVSGQQAADPAVKNNPSKAEIGQIAPAFSLKDQDGRPVQISDYRGRTVVLVWINPDCPFIQRHYREGTFKALAEDYAGKGVAVLAINSTHWFTAASNKQWYEKYGRSYPILDDSAGDVGRLYGAKTTPHLFIVNRDGILAYSGGIDNDPAGNLGEQRIHYVRQALDDLLAGTAPRAKETKPYG